MKKAVTESVTAINMKTNFNTLKKTTKVNIMMENKTIIFQATRKRYWLSKFLTSAN